MCGICGFAGRDPAIPVDENMIRRMTETLTHRGPDSDGFHVNPGVGLGVRRLSIIDVASGDQPIANEDGTIVVVCNGEIYNARELRARLEAKGHRFRTGSDVETIVHAYEESGLDFVHGLRGMFAIALWDEPRRRLVLARDRLGIKPLQYAKRPEGIFFGSEYKAIFASGAVPGRLSRQGLRGLITMGHVPGTQTLADGIRRLPPGHLLVHEDGHARTRLYWDLPFPARDDEDRGRSEADWADALRGKLEEAVRLHMRSDVPIGAWLSPGIDSSSIVRLMCDVSDGPVRSYSIGFENDACDELRRNPRLDELTDLPIDPAIVTCGGGDIALMSEEIRHCEDTSMSVGGIPRLLLARRSARDVKVVLTGEGADEILGGYPWYRGDRVLRPLSRLPLAIRRLMTLGPLGPRLFPGACRLLMASPVMDLHRFRAMMGAPLWGNGLGLLSRDAMRDTVEPVLDPPPPAGFSSWHPMNQLLYVDIRSRMLNLVVHGLDRASMAHSLEARVPFLDHEFVEFACTIPPRVKMKRLREKHILREAMKDLLPRAITTRKKRGLIGPTAEWMRRDPPDGVEDLLSERALRDSGVFDVEAVRTIRRRHRSGQADHGRELGGIVAVQMWRKHFEEEQS
jgi:asparagine synthase (glutamine-hydrolysing)